MSSEHDLPDRLLKAIHQDEKDLKRGRLRVFLGMSAGVGKTYAMLRAAHARKNEGVDVLIGVVETHGRPETASLLEGLTVLPRKKIIYRGVEIEEFDFDAVLERKPALVVVDELAHTNAPGSKHAKRYQDVVELLDRGIDVYTAINVQHLESRKDLVEKIANVTIRETVPDSVLDQASLVEVVDIAPSELLKRLKEGKVYLGEKADRAAQNFFKADALTALREIALRVTAERVDHDLQKFQETKTRAGAWATNERLMVAVSHSPHSDRIIRATRRLAYNLEAPWVAVHVDTGIQLNDEDQAQLLKNINLARELKAEVVTTSDTDIASALNRVARQKNVTQVVVGRPVKRFFRDHIEGTLLDRLVNEAMEVDVHVIRQDGKVERTPLPILKRESSPLSYWNTIWFLIGISFLNAVLDPVIGYRSVGFLFLFAVLIVGSVSLVGPTLLAAILSAFIWVFFFIPPRFTFAIREPEDVILCFIYLVVAGITGFLTSRIRRQQKHLREREERTNVLYEISQDIASSKDKSEFLAKINSRVGRLLKGQCGVVLTTPDRKLDVLTPKVFSPRLDEKEAAVAAWAFESGKSAGWSTDTLSQAQALYIPLQGLSETVGVLVYRPSTNRKLSLEQENLLFAICRQLATAIERHFFEKRALEARKLEESEQLHQTLLNSISHEMRTPLTAIIGSTQALSEDQNASRPEVVKNFASQALEASDRLNRVIENLLDMSRLNSGVLSLKREWHDVHDLINITMTRLKKNLAKHQIKVNMPTELPMLEIDFRLVEHALSNVILNAVNYSSEGSEIKVEVRENRESLSILIEDQGTGIPESAREKVFEKFYRVPGTPAGGTGLGLSIVKSIIEAHQGKVRIRSNEPKGSIFEIVLPVKEIPPVPENV